MEGSVPFEFRTTAVASLHKAEDFAQIGRWLQGAPHYYIQVYKASPGVIDQSLQAPEPLQLQAFLAAARPFIPAAQLRGIS